MTRENEAMGFWTLIALVLSLFSSSASGMAILLLRADMLDRKPLTTFEDHLVLAVLVLIGAVVTVFAVAGGQTFDRAQSKDQPQ